MSTPYNLPKALEPFAGKIRSTEKPFLRIIPEPAEALQPWNSKIGGTPYGLNEADPEAQHNFRVLYFPEPDEDEAALTTGFEDLRSYGDLPLSAGQCFTMRFERSSGPMPESDYRFDDIFGEDFFSRFGAEEWNIAEAYNHISDAAGHRIGGYAEFTQEDPRSTDDPMELLFQLDTDSKIGCRWGDMGVANFFIRPEDLQRRDFSRIFFNWDCY